MSINTMYVTRSWMIKAMYACANGRNPDYSEADVLQVINDVFNERQEFHEIPLMVLTDRMRMMGEYNMAEDIEAHFGAPNTDQLDARL